VVLENLSFVIILIVLYSNRDSWFTVQMAFVQYTNERTSKYRKPSFS